MRAQWKQFVVGMGMECAADVLLGRTAATWVRRNGPGPGRSAIVLGMSVAGTKPLCDSSTVYSAVEGQAAVPGTTTYRAHDFMADVAACSVLALLRASASE